MTPKTEVVWGRNVLINSIIPKICTFWLDGYQNAYNGWFTLHKYAIFDNIFLLMSMGSKIAENMLT